MRYKEVKSRAWRGHIAEEPRPAHEAVRDASRRRQSQLRPRGDRLPRPRVCASAPQVHSVHLSREGPAPAEGAAGASPELSRRTYIGGAESGGPTWEAAGSPFLHSAGVR